MVECIDELSHPALKLYFKALRVVNSKNEQELNNRYRDYIDELNNFKQDTYWKQNNLALMSLIYIILQVECDDKEKIIDIAVKKFPERRETIVTVAEKLREEGREEGRKEGKKETKRIIAQRMLELGEDLEKIKKVTGLSKEKIIKIKNK